jgi:hypothetical protein
VAKILHILGIAINDEVAFAQGEAIHGVDETAWELKKTKPEIVAEIDRLLDHHTEGEIAQTLNQRGWRSSAGNPFTLRMIHCLRLTYGLKTRFARLQEQGLLTARQIGPIIGSTPSRVKYWRQAGVLSGRAADSDELLLLPRQPRRHFDHPKLQSVGDVARLVLS